MTVEIALLRNNPPYNDPIILAFNLFVFGMVFEWHSKYVAFFPGYVFEFLFPDLEDLWRN